MEALSATSKKIGALRYNAVRQLVKRAMNYISMEARLPFTLGMEVAGSKYTINVKPRYDRCKNRRKKLSQESLVRRYTATLARHSDEGMEAARVAKRLLCALEFPCVSWTPESLQQIEVLLDLIKQNSVPINSRLISDLLAREIKVEAVDHTVETCRRPRTRGFISS